MCEPPQAKNQASPWTLIIDLITAVKNKINARVYIFLTDL